MMTLGKRAGYYNASSGEHEYLSLLRYFSLDQSGIPANQQDHIPKAIAKNIIFYVDCICLCQYVNTNISFIFYV